MSSENFSSVGPGKVLAYVRKDLRSATESIFLIGPWIDDYVAEQITLAASRDLSVRVLVRPKEQVEAAVWERIAAAITVFADHWSSFEARSLDKLHAKSLIIDERVAFVGSANWYRYSVEESLEIVVRGPLASIPGLQADCESLWEQADRLEIKRGSRKTPPTGITNEVLDPLAAQALKDNPKAFVLGKKPQRRF